VATHRNADLSGGFYDHRYKDDEWYYDFYEYPATVAVARTDTPTPGRTIDRDTNSASYGEPARFIDAARPLNTIRSSETRHAQETAFSRYYDDSWYYEQGDPAYAVTMRTRDNSDRTASRDQEFVVGSVHHTKQVRNITSGGQNTVALIKTADGSNVIADLGPNQALLHLALTQGDEIEVSGRRKDIGPSSVLMARHFESGPNRVILDQDAGGDSQEIKGRIEKVRDARVRGTEEIHRTVTVKTDDGRFALVDLGPSTAANVPANTAPGDRMVASGLGIHVGNYSVLLADRFSINNGAPVRIVRPDGEYIDGPRRPVETSQGETIDRATASVMDVKDRELSNKPEPKITQ